MPLYSMKCAACGHSDEEYMKMSAEAIQDCPACKTAYSYVKQVSLPHTDLHEYHTPIQMYSAACNSVEEIREMQRAGIDISDDPNDEMYGVPIAKNRKEKLRALKVAGLQEAK